MQLTNPRVTIDVNLDADIAIPGRDGEPLAITYETGSKAPRTHKVTGLRLRDAGSGIEGIRHLQHRVLKDGDTSPEDPAYTHELPARIGDQTVQARQELSTLHEQCHAAATRAVSEVLRQYGLLGDQP